MAGPARISPAPDGGWGWMVVLACSCMHMLIGGLERSFGLIYLELLEKYSASAALTGWVGPLQSAIRLCLGVFVSVLATRYGARPVASVGAIVFASGIGFSALAPVLWVQFLTYSILGGVGAACCYTPPFALLGQYFDKRRSVATGLATCGSGVGSFVVPPLVALMLRAYGFSGTLLLLSAIICHLIPCGLLYYALKTKLDSEEQCEDLAKPLLVSEYEQRDMADTNDSENTFKVASTQRSPGMFLSVDNLPNAEQDNIKSWSSHPANLQAMEVPRIEPVAAISTAYLALSQTSFIRHATSSEDVTNPARRTLFEWSMLRNRKFVFFCFTCFFVFIGTMVFLTLIAATAVEKGLSKQTSAYLLSTYGACDFLGRIGCGIVLDLKPFRSHRLLIWRLAGVVAGICTVLVTVSKAHWQFFVLSGIFGLMNGCLVSQRPVIALDMTGKERLGPAFGIVTLSQGLGFLVGLPIAGAFKDNTGNYDLSFIFCAASFFFGTGLGFVERFMTYLYAKSKATRRNPDET